MEVTIEKLIYGGEGLSHHNGSPVFVPFVLPGEQVSVLPAEKKKKFIRARLAKVLEPSPQRTAPPCPHFGICGGCDYQHIPYEPQLQYKAQILRETLRRLGRIEWPGEIAVHSSHPWNYRNRAQWKVRPLGESASRDAAESGTSRSGIGYFRAGSTALCAVENCAIVSPLLLKTFLRLRESIAAGALPHFLREIEAFADSSDSKLLLTATFAGFPSDPSGLAGDLELAIPEIESMLFHDPSRDRMELFGPGFLEYAVADVKYRVGHFSFFQVNRFLVADLAHEVVESEAGGRVALDLFAGVGLFSLPLADRFQRVVAVESNPASARDLESNARGRGRIEIRTADVERFLEKYKEEPEFVLLDPPRAGVTPQTIERLAALSPGRITYVSCEPPTLARDLALICASGYDLSQVHLFDFFPQTFHMEAVVKLTRRG